VRFSASANVSFSPHHLALLCTAAAKPEFEEIAIYLKQAITEAKILQVNYLLSSTHYAKINAINSRQKVSCCGMLGNTVSVYATGCTWIKPTKFVCTQLHDLKYPLLLRKRSWNHNTEFSESIKLNGRGW